MRDELKKRLRRVTQVRQVKRSMYIANFNFSKRVVKRITQKHRSPIGNYVTSHVENVETFLALSARTV